MRKGRLREVKGFWQGHRRGMIGTRACLYFQSQCVLFTPSSHVQLFAAPWSAACQASLSFTISRSWLKLMFIESVMPSNYLIFCHPLPLSPSIFPSIRVFPSIRNDHRFIDKIISSALWEITNKQEHFYNIKGLALF